MIIALLILVLITGFFVCAEVVCERDWPRSTIRGFFIAVLLLLAGLQAFGQAGRFDWSVTSINSSAPQPGGFYPVLAYPGAAVAICTAPANAVPCTNYATTLTAATGGSPCTAPTQLTRPGSNVCVANSDSEGAFGVWMTAGNYQYTVTTSYGSFGPYDFTVASTAGGGGGSTIGTNVVSSGADPTGNTDSTAAIATACATFPQGTAFFPQGTYLVSNTSNNTSPAGCTLWFANGAQLKTGNQGSAVISTIQRVGVHTGTLPAFNLSACTSSKVTTIGQEVFTGCGNIIQIPFGMVITTGMTNVPNCYYRCAMYAATGQTSGTFVIYNPAATALVSAAPETGQILAQSGDFEMNITGATTSVTSNVLTVTVSNNLTAFPNVVQLTGTTHTPAGTYVLIPSTVNSSGFSAVCPSCANVSSGTETSATALMVFTNGGAGYIHFATPLPGIGAYPLGYHTIPPGALDPPNIICTGTNNYNGPFWIWAIADSQDIAITDLRGSAPQETIGSCYLPYTYTTAGPIVASSSQFIVAHGSGIIPQGNSESYVGWYGAQGAAGVPPGTGPDDSLSFSEALFWGKAKRVIAPNIKTTQGQYAGYGPTPDDYVLAHGVTMYGSGQQFDGKIGGLWEIGTVIYCSNPVDPCLVTPPYIGQVTVENLRMNGPALGPTCSVATNVFIPVQPPATEVANDGWLVGGNEPVFHNLSMGCFYRDGIHMVSDGYGFNPTMYGFGLPDYWQGDNLFTGNNLGYGFSCWFNDCNAGTLQGSNNADANRYGGYFDSAEIQSTYINASGEGNTNRFAAGTAFSITSLSVSGSGYNAVCTFAAAGTSFYTGQWITISGTDGSGGAANTDSTVQALAGGLSYVCPGASGGPATTGTVQAASSNNIYTAIQQYASDRGNFYVMAGLIGGNYVGINIYSESTNGCFTGSGLIIQSTAAEYLYPGPCADSYTTGTAFSGSVISGNLGVMQFLNNTGALWRALPGTTGTTPPNNVTQTLSAPWNGENTAFTGFIGFVFSTYVDYNLSDWKMGVNSGDTFSLIDEVGDNTIDDQTILLVSPTTSGNYTQINGPGTAHSGSTGTINLQVKSTGNVNFQFNTGSNKTVVASTGITTNGLTVGTTSWSSASGAPSGACVSGSLYTNTAGTLTTTLYVCVATAWNAVTIP
jgi:Pectate lyase superfamily protein